MKLNPFLAACGCASLALACPVAAIAQDAASSAAAANPTPTDAKSYVMMAGASDLFEIQSAKVAQSKSQNQAVKDFAAMLITHHTQTTQTLMAAAKQAKMNPGAPKLMPMQKDMLKQLKAAPKADFDRTFAQQQVQAHQMALQLHQNYAQNGDNDALKGAANSAVPIIQQHLQAAQGLPM